MLVLLLLTPLTRGQASNVGNRLTVGIQSTKTAVIRPLDPQERDVMSVYNLVYESLVYIDDNYLPQGSLAKSWEVDGKGRTWTFHLQENVVFSDGTPMTAHDVIATAQYIISRASDELSSNKGYYANLKMFIKSMSAPDDHTVIVKAARPYFGLLYAMTFPVLPAALIETDNPPGTGPYKISRFEQSDLFWLETNTAWWQGRPQVEEIMFVCHDTPRSLIESYEYARVDTIFTRSVAAAQYDSGTTSITMDYRTNQLETLMFNHANNKLADLRVRQAIRYVVNPDEIANTVYMGMVERTDTFMPNGTWMYNSSITSPRDLNEARRLLLEAGWNDTNEDGILDRVDAEGKLEDFTLRLDVYEEPDNNVRLEAANMIKMALLEVGIDVTVNNMTYIKIQERLDAGSFQLALVSFAMDVCPDPGFLLMKGNTGNFGRYKNNEMHEMCQELRTCITQEAFQNKLYQIQEKCFQDCVMIPLFYRGGAVLTRMMYTTFRDVRELELMRGIQFFGQT